MLCSIEVAVTGASVGSTGTCIDDELDDSGLSPPTTDSSKISESKITGVFCVDPDFLWGTLILRIISQGVESESESDVLGSEG